MKKKRIWNIFSKQKEEPKEEVVEKLDINPQGNAPVELAKLTAKVESLLEMRKTYAEKFSLISEQIGELRGMILDTTKQIQRLELSSTKAIELVHEVQPEKFMTQIHQMAGKLESMKAHLESKDSIMNDITEELKAIRKQMSFYRGLEQVSKLSEEIKKDLVNIKKVQTIVERHADQSESVFVELQKKHGDMDAYASTLEDMKKNNKELAKMIDSFKLRIAEKTDKKDFIELLNKFDKYLTQNGIAHIQETSMNPQGLQQTEEQTNEMMHIIADLKQKTDALENLFNEAHLTDQEAVLKTLASEIQAQKDELEKTRKELYLEVNNEQDELKKIQEFMQRNNQQTQSKLAQQQSAVPKPAALGVQNQLVTSPHETTTYNQAQDPDDPTRKFVKERIIVEDVMNIPKQDSTSDEVSETISFHETYSDPLAKNQESAPAKLKRFDVKDLLAKFMNKHDKKDEHDEFTDDDLRKKLHEVLEDETKQRAQEMQQQLLVQEQTQLQMMKQQNKYYQPQTQLPAPPIQYQQNISTSMQLEHLQKKPTSEPIPVDQVKVKFFPAIPNLFDKKKEKPLEDVQFIAEKHRATRADIREHHKYFWLSNGKIARNIPELVIALAESDDSVYNHHVHDGKNDFANWIKHVFNAELLGRKAQECKNKQELIHFLS